MKYISILISGILLSTTFSCCKTTKENTIQATSPKDFSDVSITSMDSMRLLDVETTAGISPDEIEPDKMEMVMESPKPNNNGNHPIKVKSPVGGGNNNTQTNNSGINITEVNNSKVINSNTDLTQGRIVYKIPEKMKVRTTYKILVRIAQSEKTISIYSDGLSGNVMASNIPITETMEVKLIDVSPKDNKAFDIEDGNSAIQLIENGDTYTEWSWDVTPIRVGNSNLKIVVSVIRDDKKKDIVYEDTVEVEKDILVQILFFLKKYWQVLMTSMAIPFIVFLYKKRKDDKEKEIDAKKNNTNTNA